MKKGDEGGPAVRSGDGWLAGGPPPKPFGGPGTPTEEPPASFPDVRQREAAAIEERRRAAGVPPDAPLTGVGLSGGGIRSATFCLGFLQALHESGLIKKFDYASMVSGGGYVGGWWSAWLSRPQPPRTDVFPEAEEIEPLDLPAPAGGTQPKARGPIRHLRLFSNYITPRKGAFSADTWRAVAVASRNLVLIWLVLLPLLFAALAFVQLLLVSQPHTGQAFLNSHDIASRWAAVAPTFELFLGVLVTTLFIVIASWLIVSSDLGHWGFLVAAAVGHGAFIALALFHPSVSRMLHWPWGLSDPQHQSMLKTWAVAAGIFVVLYLALNRRSRRSHERLRRRKDVWRNLLVRGHAAILVAALLLAIALLCASFGDLVWRHLVLGVGNGVRGQAEQAGGIAALLISAASAIITAFKAAPVGGAEVSATARPSRLTRLAIAVSPFLVLVVLAVAGAYLAREALQALRVGVFDAKGIPAPPLHHGRSLYEWVIIGALAGVALCQIIALTDVLRKVRAPWNALLPALCLALWVIREQIPPPPRWTVLAVVVAAVGVMGTAFLRVTLAERRASPTGRRGRKPLLVALVVMACLVVALGAVALRDPGWWSHLISADRFDRSIESAILLVVGVLITAVGTWQRALAMRSLLLLAVPALLAAALALLNLAEPTLRWTWDTAAVIGLGGTALTFAIGLGWMTDPNLISLHGFYRSRLVRAYLGASNPTRGRADVTEAVEGDDLALSAVRNHVMGAPYPLINTTLNLIATKDLATSQRMSASFLLSPFYCGSIRTGFRDTDKYMTGAMTLGTALAISGAAASPAMGTVRVSSALAMLLTLLNVRLGFWAPHPARPSWQSPQARMWTFYILREFFSQTDETSSYLYLTDGGHFDNTGIYELVQRGCQRIVIVDCGHDPLSPPALSDLGQAIRMCRIDFGAEFDIDVQKLKGSDAPGMVPGTIRYSDKHLQALGFEGPADQEKHRVAQLIWIKPSLGPDEVIAADVRQYSRRYQEFPQQSTGDLWYDEAQFESYRKLGFCAAAGLAAVLEQPVRNASNNERQENVLGV